MKNTGKIIAALVMLLAAGFFIFRFWRDNRDVVPRVYFYDLSEKKLFAAPRDQFPPILGTDGKVQDAMRAVVYSPSGDCERDRKIAYLEKYSDQLKAEFEKANANPGLEFPRMSRGAAQSHTFVARVEELKWHAIDTEEGGRIVGEWRLAHPNSEATICVP